MNLGVSFAPLVPAYVVWAAFGAAVLISVMLLLARSRGAPMRALALGADGAGARQSVADARRPRSDPLGRRRHRRQEPEPGFRRPQRADAKPRAPRWSSGSSASRASKCASPKRAQADGETDGTRLFSALSATLADVPPDRVAGAIMITDGRVHDVPADAAALGFAAPLHALITGHKNEIDRRVVLTQTPRFGIVGQSQTIGFRVEDQGAKVGAAEVTVRRDGEVLEKRVVTVRHRHQGQRADPACRAEHRRDRGLAARQRTHPGQQPRGDLDRRRARQAARAAGVGRAACRRAHLAQPA